MAEIVGGALKNVSLDKLRPDWTNPRFPPGAAEHFVNDLDVYAYLDKQFDAASVAESIARHGFFLSEPLIAIPASGSAGDYIVVEGNRRLAALQGLARQDARERMSDPRWKSFPKELDTPSEVPVLVASSREEVAPILGYRHVTGIAPWDPYQQARYVSTLIDDNDSDLSAADVAQLIGRDVSEVRSFYRNYSIVEQARDVFETPDPGRMVDEFGVWTRAMTSSSLREYISAPPPRDVVEREYPLPEEAADRLGRLITWIFGKPRSTDELEAGRQSKEGRVISDSRQLTRLGRVVANARGASALEAGELLAEAELAVLDESIRFIEAIEKARKELTIAYDHATLERVAQYQDAVNAVARLVDDIKAAG